MRISDWISDVCSSYLGGGCPTAWRPARDVRDLRRLHRHHVHPFLSSDRLRRAWHRGRYPLRPRDGTRAVRPSHRAARLLHVARQCGGLQARSEEHASELQSLMRISYAVFCLKKTKHNCNLTIYTID